jgi:NTE family protein
MPRSIRLLLRGLGALNYGGRQLLSYLLFESGYTRELIALGYADAMDRREQIMAFLAGNPVDAPGGIVGWRAITEEYSQRLRTLAPAPSG